MDIAVAGYTLSGLEDINVILGKNGSGKSSLLRAFDRVRRTLGHVRYITPERGGVLTRDGNIETNIANGTWLVDVRSRNRFEQFRQTSTAEFRRLETLVLRKIERNPDLRANLDYTFDNTVAEMNTLLENVEMVRSPDGGFQVKNRGGGDARDNETLSSGESELISLAIEILAFSFSSEDDEYKDKSNWLLLDEPDVHLHPDLQQKLMALLVRAQKGKPFKVCIATHSTSIVSSLADLSQVRVSFMGKGQTSLVFEPATPALRAVMPIFGAHPLSNVFNERPILLVEGDDEERIWQQATRSSKGAIRIWPCVAGDVQSLNKYETVAQSILNAVYDGAVAYSLRDRDGGLYQIDDIPPVIRMRLSCRTSENLLFSDDVLSLMGTDWPTVQHLMDEWLDGHTVHPQYNVVKEFKEAGWNRKDAKVKQLRNLVLALIGYQRPWEVAVGQAIARLKLDAPSGPHTLTDYLGPKLVTALSLHP